MSSSEAFTRHNQAASSLGESHTETCEWFGVKWAKDGSLLPCGEPVVGSGLFCDPKHLTCRPMNVCERHNRNGKVERWQ